MAGCEPAPGVGIVNIRHSVELDLSKSDRYTGQITSDLELDNPRQDLALAFDAGVIEMVRLNGQLLPLNYAHSIQHPNTRLTHSRNSRVHAINKALHQSSKEFRYTHSENRE